MFKIGEAAGGRYTVIREIGRGGTGIVYLVLQNNSGRLLAMKVMHPEPADIFAREGELLKRLRHPGLSELTDVFEEDGCCCLVMTMIEGRTLKRVIESHEKADGIPYDAADILSWGIQLCDVLGYLHSRPQPVIHMDLKPANIMLTPEGGLKLLDFGASLMFLSGSILGTRAATPDYAAPEAAGGMPGPWTDIYGLGRLLFELAGGLSAEKAAEDAASLAALRPVIRRCMMARPAKRYASCAVLSAALEGIQGACGKTHARRGRAIKALTACAALALAACALTLWPKPWREGRSRDEFDAQAYTLYLEQLTADGVLDAEEFNDLQALLYDQAGEGGDHLSRLRQDAAGYAAFAFQLGTALYECADDQETRQRSDYWLQQMLDASASFDDPPWPARKSYAMQLHEMNTCAAALGRSIASPDEAGRLWTALGRLASLAAEGQLSRRSGLAVIGDIAVNIYDHAAALQWDGGVTIARQQALLTRMEDVLAGLAPFSSGESSLAGRAETCLQAAEAELEILKQ